MACFSDSPRAQSHSPLRRDIRWGIPADWVQEPRPRRVLELIIYAQITPSRVEMQVAYNWLCKLDIGGWWFDEGLNAKCFQEIWYKSIIILEESKIAYISKQETRWRVRMIMSQGRKLFPAWKMQILACSVYGHFTSLLRLIVIFRFPSHTSLVLPPIRISPFSAFRLRHFNFLTSCLSTPFSSFFCRKIFIGGLAPSTSHGNLSGLSPLSYIPLFRRDPTEVLWEIWRTLWLRPHDWQDHRYLIPF